MRKDGKTCYLTWWCTWEAQLDHDTNEIHVSESRRVHAQGTRCGKEKNGSGADERSTKMDDSVWQPREHIENSVFMC